MSADTIVAFVNKVQSNLSEAVTHGIIKQCPYKTGGRQRQIALKRYKYMLQRA
jgi:hypothetical protein